MQGFWKARILARCSRLGLTDADVVEGAGAAGDLDLGDGGLRVDQSQGLRDQPIPGQRFLQDSEPSVFLNLHRARSCASSQSSSLKDAAEIGGEAAPQISNGVNNVVRWTLGQVALSDSS